MAVALLLGSVRDARRVEVKPQKGTKGTKQAVFSFCTFLVAHGGFHRSFSR